jgi:hypothetical protein
MVSTYEYFIMTSRNDIICKNNALRHSEYYLNTVESAFEMSYWNVKF